MEDLLDQIVTIKALLNDLEMSIMQHKLNPLNEQQTGQCVMCLWWSGLNNICNKYKAVPPPEIISGKQKCEGFEIDDIPF